jgi:hypothetical protein
MNTEATTAANRVRKMLALANNAAATEGERDNALRMAFATMAKHNIQMSDVAHSGTPDEAREQQVAQLSVYPWARSIAHSMADLFFCAYYFQRPWKGKRASHYFVGKQSNAITANEMACYVVGSVFKELRQRYGSETAPEARAFATGAADKLRARVRTMQREATTPTVSQGVQAGAPGSDVMIASTSTTPGNALVLANLYKTEREANDAWVLAHEGELKTAAPRTKHAGGSAYHEGAAFGGKVSLNTQVGASRSNTLKIK